MSDDAIPCLEQYRGVGIHDHQPRRRIDRVVKPAIDRVFAMSDPDELFDFARDIGNPPEARTFAAAKCRAAWQIATDNRQARPTSRLDDIAAAVAGLNSQRRRIRSATAP